MKKFKALGPNLIIKMETAELKSAGGIVLAAEGTREATAREEAVIVQLGEDAFSDLEEVNRPTVGSRIALARYDGKTLEENRDKGYEIRVIADTRVLAIIEETDDVR